MMSFISIIQLPCFANCPTNILFLILQSSIVFNWYIALVSSNLRELVFLFVFFFFFFFLQYSWLWLRSWTPYCQIQTDIEENGENH